MILFYISFIVGIILFVTGSQLHSRHFMSKHDPKRVDFDNPSLTVIKKMLLDDLREAKKEVVLVSGSLNSDLFNDEAVAEAFKQLLSKNKVKLKVVLGPYLSVKGVKKRNLTKEVLEEYLDKPQLELFLASEPTLAHYRIIDFGESVCYEAPHSYLTPIRKRHLTQIINSTFASRNFIWDLNRRIKKGIFDLQKDFSNFKICYG